MPFIPREPMMFGIVCGPYVGLWEVLSFNNVNNAECTEGLV